MLLREAHWIEERVFHQLLSVIVSTVRHAAVFEAAVAHNNGPPLDDGHHVRIAGAVDVINAADRLGNGYVFLSAA